MAVQIQISVYDGKRWVNVGRINAPRNLMTALRAGSLPAIARRVPPPQDRKPLFGTR